MDVDDGDQTLFEMLEGVDDLEGLFRDEPNVASVIVNDLAGGSRSQPVGYHAETDDEDEKQDLELLQRLLSRLNKTKEPPSAGNVPEVELKASLKSMNEEDSLKYLLGEINGALSVASKMKNRLVEFEQELIRIADQLLSNGNETATEESNYFNKIPDGGYLSVDLDKFLKAFKKPYFKTPNGFDSPRVPPVDQYLPCDPDLLPKSLFTEEELISFRSEVWVSFKRQLENEAIRKKDARLTAEVVGLDTGALTNRLTSAREAELDWVDIASMSMSLLPSECKRVWSLCLSPGVNKLQWDEEESEKLKDLAVEHKYQNWDEIAKELGTFRTGYQCFVKYHSSLSREKTGPWTDVENSYLEKIVSMSSYGDRILWNKVCYYIENRNIHQLSQRYKMMHNNRKMGMFSLEEDEFLLRNIDKIKSVGQQKCLRRNLDRDSMQVSSRLRDHLKKTLTCRYNEFTEEEDRRLLRLHERFGQDRDCFALIAKHFKTRNRNQIRHRYNRLRSILDRNPELDLSNIRRGKKGKVDARRNKILKLAHDLDLSCGETSDEEIETKEGSDEEESDRCDEEDDVLMHLLKPYNFPFNVKLKVSDMVHHVPQMQRALSFVFDNNSQLSEPSRKNVKLRPQNDFIYDNILKEIFKSFPVSTRDEPSTSAASRTPTVEPLFPDLAAMEALSHIYEKIEHNKAVNYTQRRVSRICSNNQMSDFFSVCETIFTWPILLSLLNKREVEEIAIQNK